LEGNNFATAALHDAKQALEVCGVYHVGVVTPPSLFHVGVVIPAVTVAAYTNATCWIDRRI